MQTCGKCMRARNQGAIYCTGCGTRFPDSSQQSPGTADGQDAGAGEPASKYRHPGLPAVIRSKRLLRSVSVAGVAIIIAAVSWLFISNSGRPAGGPEPGSSAGTANTNEQIPSTPGSSPGGSTVRVAPDAGQDPAAPSVEGFLDQYFAAIKAHDYQSYISLYDPNNPDGGTAEQFDSGYRSTADSGETLTGISAAANGDTVATVTFTSHQDPADSHYNENCTDWKISLFLKKTTAGYLIEKPPSNYHGAHSPCR